MKYKDKIDYTYDPIPKRVNGRGKSRHDPHFPNVPKVKDVMILSGDFVLKDISGKYLRMKSIDVQYYNIPQVFNVGQGMTCHDFFNIDNRKGSGGFMTISHLIFMNGKAYLTSYSHPFAALDMFIIASQTHGSYFIPLYRVPSRAKIGDKITKHIVDNWESVFPFEVEIVSGTNETVDKLIGNFFKRT